MFIRMSCRLHEKQPDEDMREMSAILLFAFRLMCAIMSFTLRFEQREQELLTPQRDQLHSSILHIKSRAAALRPAADPHLPLGPFPAILKLSHDPGLLSPYSLPQQHQHIDIIKIISNYSIESIYFPFDI